MYLCVCVASIAQDSSFEISHVMYISSLPLFIAKSYSIVWIYHDLFIHSLMMKLLWTFLYHADMFSCLLDEHLGIQLLYHSVAGYLNCQTLCQSVCIIMHSSRQCESSSCSIHISCVFDIVSHFDFRSHLCYNEKLRICWRFADIWLWTRGCRGIRGPDRLLRYFQAVSRQIRWEWRSFCGRGV